MSWIRIENKLINLDKVETISYQDIEEMYKIKFWDKDELIDYFEFQNKEKMMEVFLELEAILDVDYIGNNDE